VYQGVRQQRLQQLPAGLRRLRLHRDVSVTKRLIHAGRLLSMRYGGQVQRSALHLTDRCIPRREVRWSPLPLTDNCIPQSVVRWSPLHRTNQCINARSEGSRCISLTTASRKARSGGPLHRTSVTANSARSLVRTEIGVRTVASSAAHRLRAEKVFGRDHIAKRIDLPRAESAGATNVTVDHVPKSEDAHAMTTSRRASRDPQQSLEVREA
jgi:hypothetical protein